MLTGPVKSDFHQPRTALSTHSSTYKKGRVCFSIAPELDFRRVGSLADFRQTAAVPHFYRPLPRPVRAEDIVKRATRLDFMAVGFSCTQVQPLAEQFVPSHINCRARPDSGLFRALDCGIELVVLGINASIRGVEKRVMPAALPNQSTLRFNRRGVMQHTKHHCSR